MVYDVKLFRTPPNHCHDGRSRCYALCHTATAAGTASRIARSLSPCAVCYKSTFSARSARQRHRTIKTIPTRPCGKPAANRVWMPRCVGGVRWRSANASSYRARGLAVCAEHTRHTHTHHTYSHKLIRKHRVVAPSRRRNSFKNAAFARAAG